MRADSFLWSIRLFKTRNLAAESIKSGRVSIQNIVIKSSRTLKIGDELIIRQKGYLTTHLVLDFPKSRVNASLVENFMKTTTSKEETEKKEMLLIALKLQRTKGFGRPTKRDRRDLKDWY